MAEDEWKLNPWEEQVIPNIGEDDTDESQGEEGWRLDPFTENVPKVTPEIYEHRRTLAAINRLLYEELGFYGVTEQFSHPEAYFIDSVSSSLFRNDESAHFSYGATRFCALKEVFHSV